MGFRIKVAPGIRIGVSSRGVRASVGPRLARVHVGAGGSGFSSGLGPITYSTSLTSSGKNQTIPGSFDSYFSAPSQQELNVKFAHSVLETLNKWSKAHLLDYPQVSKPSAPIIDAPSLQEYFRQSLEAETQGLPLLALNKRREAKQRAWLLALERRQEQIQQNAIHSKNLQSEIDAEWARLCANDEDYLVEVFSKVVGEKKARFSLIGAEGSEASILMAAPDVSVIPRSYPRMNSEFDNVVVKLSATQIGAYFYSIVGSQFISIAKQVFSIAPKIETARIVIVAFSEGKGKCIGYGVLRRQDVIAKDFAGKSSIEILEQLDAWVVNVDSSKTFEMREVNFQGSEDITQLMSSLEFAESLDEITEVSKLESHFQIVRNALKLIVVHRFASASFLQRHLGLRVDQSDAALRSLIEIGAISESQLSGTYDVKVDEGNLGSFIQRVSQLG